MSVQHNRDYRFDVQLSEGLVQEGWFYEMTCAGDRFEVKHDRRAQSTRNLYVEYEHDPGHRDEWQPSGISTTEADCWIFVVGDPVDCFIGVATNRLKRLAAEAKTQGSTAKQPVGSCPTRGALVSIETVLRGGHAARRAA